MHKAHRGVNDYVLANARNDAALGVFANTRCHDGQQAAPK